MKDIASNLKNKLKGPAGQSLEAINSERNWYSDKAQSLEIQRSILFVVLVISVALIAFLSFNLSYIKSTRSIEPFVIEIEPKTGVATVVTALDSKVYSEDEVIKRYFVWQYVKLREEYSQALYDVNLNRVELYSTPEVFSTYLRGVRRGNKNSPIESLADKSFLEVNLKSITFKAENKNETTASIRFKTNVTGQSNVGGGDFIVTLTFVFQNANLNEQQRLENPLGFFVKRYIKESEFVGS